VDGKPVGRKSGSTGRGAFSRRLNPSRIGARPAFFRPADNELKTIFSGDNLNWIDWLGNERLRVGAAKFIHAIMDRLPHNIHCEIDKAAMRAGHNVISVSISLARRERDLIAALAARKNETAVHSHLEKLGFIKRSAA
jgi:hypothetical protein